MKKHPRNNETPTLWRRSYVQAGFFILCLAMGLIFYSFVNALGQGMDPGWSRPAGVEAFLPISALLSFRYWLETGIFSNVHPAGLSLFLIICATALLFKKGFCAWVCPVGFLSDLLARLHTRLFRRRLALPSWPDRILGLVKYGLLGFFVYTIFFTMPIPALAQFIDSPYNRFADIKMLEFFTQMSPRAALILTALGVLSLILPHFWCRYLCPYGGLLGLLSFLSLGRIKRNTSHCIRCGQCQAHCPGQIKILEKSNINSPDCSACLTCVSVCPQPKAIGFHLARSKKTVSMKTMAISMVLIFALGIGAAKLTRHWETAIPLAAYKAHLAPQPRMPFSMGRMPKNAMPRDPEKLKRMMEKIRQMKEKKARAEAAQAQTEAAATAP
ncbi:MAG: 4Fe-4S binding protein [Desulfobacterales bacterium]|nr:4Fe-4S binding protein [Desulfobacterales bacterium]